MLKAAPDRSSEVAGHPGSGSPREPFDSGSVDLARVNPATAHGERLGKLAAKVLASLRGSSGSSPWGRRVDWELFAELTAESLRSLLSLLGEDAPPTSCLAVDAGIIESYLTEPSDLRPLLRWQRLCQGEVWEFWCAALERADLTPVRRRELLAGGSAHLLRYADLFNERAAEAQEALVAGLARAPAPSRFEAIRGFLDGDPLAPPWLDLDLDRHHLAVVAWGVDHAGLARRLATLLERPIRAIDTPDGALTWAWLSGARPLTDALDTRKLESVCGAGGNLALGLDLRGEAGFRASHRQAERARLLAAGREGPLVRYEDLAVELLLSENDSEARAFLAYELAGIDDDSASSRRLRETIAAYFAAEHNAASAAAALGVHQQTVANRLRVAEERLGHPVGARRIELEMALRLRAVLDPESAHEDS
jgi:PucR C-terminal helix-turn-helix domain